MTRYGTATARELRAEARAWRIVAEEGLPYANREYGSAYVAQLSSYLGIGHETIAIMSDRLRWSAYVAELSSYLGIGHETTAMMSDRLQWHADADPGNYPLTCDRSFVLACLFLALECEDEADALAHEPA